jgi:hypothetical protein
MPLPPPFSARRRSVLCACAIALALAAAAPGRPIDAQGVDALSDQAFWRLTVDLSEPDGSFRSDNLVSNELVFPRVVPQLTRHTRPNGVYLGVGPEQNFTYIAAMRPSLAFVIDIRRGNLQLQLLYKALFELSDDRVDFVARLFSRERPAGLDRDVGVKALFDAILAAPTLREAEYDTNLQAVLNLLTRTHALPLSADDRDGIDFVYSSFRRFGPLMTWSSSAKGMVGGRTTYADLMTYAGDAPESFSYLASHGRFAIVKQLQARNRVIPIVGDFAGPKALRALGRYLRDTGRVLSAFYLSNVESYLRQDEKWQAFCENVATMPFGEDSVFVRPTAVGAPLHAGPSLRPTPLATPLGYIADEIRACSPAPARRLGF